MDHGFLNVLKPPGMTSHDVVAWARRLLGTKKIGHGGTLDPGVGGVLPLAVGNGTRLLEYFADGQKAYRAEMVFGLVTTTQDLTGEVLADHGPVHLEEDRVRQALLAFEGEIEQIPPMVSAVKLGGKRLYQLAREGVEVERPPRRVTIHRIDFLQYLPDGPYPRLRFDVVCSKGTYVRTLCHDLGQALGVGGAMSHLLRTRSGPFRLEEAMTIEEITQWVEGGKNPLLPLSVALRDYPVYRAGRDEITALRQGRKIPLPAGHPGLAGIYQVQDETGRIAAVALWEREADRPWLVPKKVLAE